MSDTLKITLLCTGIPNADMNAFGTSTLIEAGDEVVMLDCGRGAVIRLAQAGYPLGYVDTIIISHYHSDHFSGLFDLAMTGTIQQPFSNRGGPLHVYGPPGIDDIAEGAWQATKPDRDIRVADHEIDPEHMRIIPYTYEQEGVVYDRGGLRIIAIEVDHGEFIRPAYAFRVEYGGHVFVHSHDTRYNENLIAQAQGADVFIHEIASARPQTLIDYPRIQVAIDHHATPEDVGRIATQAGCKQLVLNHYVPDVGQWSTLDDFTQAAGTTFDGKITAGRDLLEIPF